MALPNNSAPPESTKAFRVIIAGGGIAGLAFSLVFQKMGVDHVLLEKGKIAPPCGASVSLWAQGSRILQQLDCLDALRKTGIPLKKMVTRAKDGKVFAEANIFELITHCNGYDFSCNNRQTLLQTMYDQLPDKSHVKVGKCVSNVIETQDGIRVEMTDGTIEEGDILLGCDGVHSTVREFMWRDANRSIPDYITAKEKTSLVTTFTGLCGASKTIPGLAVPAMTSVHNDKMSFLFLTQPDLTYFCVYSKLPNQTTWPNKSKYSQEDTEKAAAALAEHPVSDSLVFGEIWKNLIRGQLISLEEGIYDHWHFGRTALIGDSAHKGRIISSRIIAATPIFGLGANNALEGVAALTNEINRMLKALKPGEKPTKDSISAMFHRYQEKHKPRMKVTYDLSYGMTRLQTCDGFINRMNMLYILPYKGFSTLVPPIADIFAGASKFDFIPIKYDKTATVKWKDEREPILESIEERKVNGVKDKIKSTGGFLLCTACFAIVGLLVFL